VLRRSINAIAALGDRFIHVSERIGLSGVLVFHTLCRPPRLWRTFPLVMHQLYFVGVLSLLIVITSGAFIGMVVSLQGHHTLEKFGASQDLGQLLALSVVRELGPVVTALLFAGRAGTALTAEIGLMQTTEQIASMEMMAVDPLWRVISPRLWAGLLSLPLLTMVFSAMAILGGYVVGVDWLGVDAGSFWSNMQASVDFRLDVINGVIKSCVFGLVCTWVAVFQGYYCVPTAAGVAQATTNTVVYSSLLVLGLDFVLTAVMLGGW
jgi:phospholipid/cholesterol/gamma-HCH transport system permease protein